MADIREQVRAKRPTAAPGRRRWPARLALVAFLSAAGVAFDATVLEGRVRRELLSGSILHEPLAPGAQVRRAIERATSMLWDAVRP